MTGDSAHRRSIGIVDLTPKNTLPPGTIFGCSNAPANRIGNPFRSIDRDRKEARIREPESREDPRFTELIEGLLRHGLHQGSQNDEVEVSVDGRLARLVN